MVIMLIVIFLVSVVVGYTMGVMSYWIQNDYPFNWRVFTAPFSNHYFDWLDKVDPGWWRR